MATLLLIRPNDFLAPSVMALARGLGLDPQVVATSAALESVSLAGVVGAVASTAVTSVMPLSLREAVESIRRRSRTLPLVATTLLTDPAKAAEAVLRDLAGLQPPLEACFPDPPCERLGTARGVLVLNQAQLVAPTPATLDVVRRHLRV